MSKRLHMIYVEVFFHFYGLFYHYQNTKSKYYISNTLTLKSNKPIFTRKKNVLDNVMCPDSDRYFNFISIYRWQSMQYRGSPQSEWWHSDVQSKKMPVWLRVCWQKEHVCCVLSYRTWKITNTGICNTDLVLFCLLVSFKI